MAITKKDTALIWQLITDAQHTAWLEGQKTGDNGGAKDLNPYPRVGDTQEVMKLYRLMRGIE
jgi:hypothetical protein